MAFYSEAYHESIAYSPYTSGDPVTLHWEKQVPLVKTYEGCPRYSLDGGGRNLTRNDLFSLASSSSTMLNKVFTQLKNDVCADGLASIGVYAMIRGESVPDGIYYYDRETSELILLSAENVKARETLMERFVASFPKNDFIQEAPLTLFFTGLLDRAVWRYKEAAYRELQLDAGSYVGLVSILARSLGGIAIPVGGFVDDEIAVVLNLTAMEIPLSAVSMMPKALKRYETATDFAYSNRGEPPILPDGAKYASRFMRQNRAECISDIDRSMKVCRVVHQPLDGEEFPLTPLKFPNEYFFQEYGFLGPGKMSFRSFKPWRASLDDFSTILRWMEICNLNAFGAGLVKIWVVSFDVQLVYPGMFRYLPSKKSLYLLTSPIPREKFCKCHLANETAENVSFAVFFTANLNEACNILGERAYRYLNLNAGYVAEMLRESARGLGKYARREMFFCEENMKRLCHFPDEESLLCEVLVGR